MLTRQSKLSSVKIAARKSPLSQVQVAEMLCLLNVYYPNLHFDHTFVDTIGDMDKKSSLRGLEKTDFFTREIDRLVLEHVVDVGIHSAKDLPDPLPQGLVIAAITQGIDPSDALVVKDVHHVNVVATSSLRREEAVLAIYPQARFVDIRGTIAERLAQLDQGHIDGVVIAEAALIRLQLTHVKRITLPGQTAPLQGRLAAVCREDDTNMRHLFAPVDTQHECFVLPSDGGISLSHRR